MRYRRHESRVRASVLRRAGLAAGVLVLAWGVGFAWFVTDVLQLAAPPAPAGGIVVLTGGAGRMKEAFRLLLEGAAPRLLVSGVAPRTHLSDLARLGGIPDGRLAGRVVLGRSAATTHGNAREAASWARSLDLDSLIIVTSFYHMPRALTEFRRALPDVRLEPAPVPPPGPPLEWRAGLWRVVAAEYTKWLAAKAGLSGLVSAWERGEQA